MLVLINLIFTIIVIVLICLYVYGLWSNVQTLILKENLVKELELLKDYRTNLIEQNDALCKDLAVKVSQNEELQQVLLELTKKQAEGTLLPILATIAGSLIFIGVILYVNNFFSISASTDTVIDSASTSINQTIDSQIEIANMIKNLHETTHECLNKIESLQTQNFSQISEIMVLSDKIDSIELKLSQGPFVEISQDVLNMGINGFGAI